ncbi:MAG: hypothetical protein HW388_1296 [Dehalococcoidia bacterium]|nr:hypothetical protein [Dehalococcoidia bacterium]
MAHVLVRHKVESYAKWRAVFDKQVATRAANGAIGARVFRSGDDPWEVFVLLEWDELEKARKFTKSDELRQAMEQAGVTGQPDVHFLHEM